MSEVRVVPADPMWPTQFRTEADRLLTALAGCDVEIHHIGSTAILGIAAKPIIDMMLLTESLGLLDEKAEAIKAIGYEAMGEFGIPGRRYFRKNDVGGNRTHHLHSFVYGSANAERHLAFRDYMNSKPNTALEYSALKLRLAAAHPDDMSAYMDGKDEFIKLHEMRALSVSAHT